jgi:hypothetical protein
MTLRPLFLPAIILLFAGPGPAAAQWVDPPPYRQPEAAPAPAAPAPPPPQASPREVEPPEGRPASAPQRERDHEAPSPLDRAKAPATEDTQATPEAAPPDPTAPPVRQDALTPPDRGEPAARQAFVDYLSFWSDADAASLDAVSAFYRPTVRFYGRLVGIDEVARQKRQFMLRWPVRDYAALLDTVDARCDADGRLCDVEGRFSFDASNPDRGRRSRGIGHLVLRFAFDTGGPRIIAESSRVVARGARPGGRADREGDF